MHAIELIGIEKKLKLFLFTIHMNGIRNVCNR